jgi:hypothetical protein
MKTLGEYCADSLTAREDQEAQQISWLIENRKELIKKVQGKIQDAANNGEISTTVGGLTKQEASCLVAFMERKKFFAGKDQGLWPLFGKNYSVYIGWITL